jgi:hypothetical protein
MNQWSSQQTYNYDRDNVLFVKELSLAAGANFYPYFVRWGFPVNRSIYKELKHLPKAKLFE